jgi:flagellar protein FlaG
MPPIDPVSAVGKGQPSSAPGKPATPVSAAKTGSPRQELPGTGQKDTPEPNADLRQAVDRLNDMARTLKRDLQFRVDETTDRVVVTVVDSETQEMIRQIPSEEVLALARSLSMTQGSMVNTRA